MLKEHKTGDQGTEGVQQEKIACGTSNAGDSVRFVPPFSEETEETTIDVETNNRYSTLSILEGSPGLVGNGSPVNDINISASENKYEELLSGCLAACAGTESVTLESARDTSSSVNKNSMDSVEGGAIVPVGTRSALGEGEDHSTFSAPHNELLACDTQDVKKEVPATLISSKHPKHVESFSFWLRVFQSLPINKLRPSYLIINVAVYAIQICIWIYVRVSTEPVAVEIIKLFLAVVLFFAALGFLIYGGRLFIMLTCFPIESKGRRKKLNEPWISRAYDPRTRHYSKMYYNHPEVQKALHANVTGIKYQWNTCRDYFVAGSMAFAEKMVLTVFGMLVVLWLTRSLTNDVPGWGALFHGRVGDGTVSVMMATLLFIIPNRKNPGEKLMDWNKCKKLHWNIILLLGAGFAIADGVKTSGLADVLSKSLAFLEIAPYLAIAPFVCLVSSTMTEL